MVETILLIMNLISVVWVVGEIITVRQMVKKLFEKHDTVVYQVAKANEKCKQLESELADTKQERDFYSDRNFVLDQANAKLKNWINHKIAENNGQV